MQRLFAQNLYHEGAVNLDSSGRIRIDDWEMRPDVQTAVSELWPQLTTENLFQLTDFASYEKNFLALFGFGCGNIDYDEPVETEIYHGDMK
jgi:enoyl-[acyl-carrier protein] reductase/trans-2-enoyl-CoA reductase (NAD+)